MRFSVCRVRRMHLDRVVRYFTHRACLRLAADSRHAAVKILRQNAGSSTMRSPSVVEREEKDEAGTMVTANPALTRLEFVIMSLAL